MICLRRLKTRSWSRQLLTTSLSLLPQLSPPSRSLITSLLSQLRPAPPSPSCPRSLSSLRITYILKDGTEQTVTAEKGDNVMYLAHKHNIEIEGACEGSLACCTCHVYVDPEFYDRIPEPTEDEEDMLDMAPELSDNSRLSCQIVLDEELDGIRITLPRITRNFYVDGHVPQPH